VEVSKNRVRLEFQSTRSKISFHGIQPNEQVYRRTRWDSGKWVSIPLTVDTGRTDHDNPIPNNLRTPPSNFRPSQLDLPKIIHTQLAFHFFSRHKFKLNLPQRAPSSLRSPPQSALISPFLGPCKHYSLPQFETWKIDKDCLWKYRPSSKGLDTSKSWMAATHRTTSFTALLSDQAKLLFEKYHTYS